MKKYIKVLISLLCAVVMIFAVSCKKDTAVIILPDTINFTSDKTQPLLKVYDTESKTIVEMKLEDYLLGVVAGEMFSSWPLEALKAQAILARTYTLYFLQNYKSKYEGADISNDVTEAQAYSKANINETIKQAVTETAGKVMLCNDELIEAWFHSNSGGVTTTSKNGLNFLEEESYTMVKSSPETEENSENYTWNSTFTKTEILTALREMGVSVNSISSFAVGEKDESGRAKTIKIGNSEINANTFRIKIGSTKMKSTLITNIIVSNSSVNISGKGYGHGVGLSQWGARILAEQGKTAEEIINYYFKDIDITLAKY